MKRRKEEYLAKSDRFLQNGSIMRRLKLFLLLTAVLTAFCGVQAHVIQPGARPCAPDPAEVVSFSGSTSFQVKTPTITEWSSGRLFAGGFEVGYGGEKRLVPGIGMVWIGCHSNPVNSIDPDGKRTIFVHGTWAFPKTYSPRFKATISQMFDEDPSNISEIDWSFEGDNDWVWAREIGAHMLFEEILSVPAGEPINIVAHSHGVSVAYLASEMLAEHNLSTNSNIQIANLIAISGPAIEDYYRPYMSVIGSLNAISNQMDGVQINAGMNRNVDLGTIFAMAIIKKKGDRGDAARLLKQQPGITNILFTEEEVWDYGLGFMAYSRAHSFPKEDPRNNKRFWEKEVNPRLNLICP